MWEKAMKRERLLCHEAWYETSYRKWRNLTSSSVAGTEPGLYSVKVYTWSKSCAFAPPTLPVTSSHSGLWGPIVLVQELLAGTQRCKYVLCLLCLVCRHDLIEWFVERGIRGPCWCGSQKSAHLALHPSELLSPASCVFTSSLYR